MIILLNFLNLLDVWCSDSLRPACHQAHLCCVQQQVLPACFMAPFIKASWSSWKQLV